MRYRCIIVDDEPISTGILSKYIESVPVLELLGTCSNSLEAFNFLLSQKIDLIFLDIGMPDMPGTELVKILKHPPAVIFITAYREFALEAFELDAVDYLIKPVSFERFLRAIHKLPQNLLEYEVMGPKNNHIYFRTSRKMIKVVIDDILFIESLKDYILIHRLNEPDVKIKLAFNTLESILPRKAFLRIHRSYIVAIPKVTAYSKEFVEIGKQEIPIGRKYKEVAAALASD